VDDLYKYSSRGFQPANTTVDIGNLSIGSNAIAVIAGPCTVKNYENMHSTGMIAKTYGAHMLRGGVFKTRTSPDSFQGMGKPGLEILSKVKTELCLPVVTEVVDVNDISSIIKHVDMIQVGSRNMQNTTLLKAIGKLNIPVLLKRGFGCTIAEFLAAADYILAGGNPQVILCERGIRTFETSARFSLDILSIPIIKKLSHLPLLVDPSHAAGNAEYVLPVAAGAIAAGADGLLVEVDSSPQNALVDGKQSLDEPLFCRLMQLVKSIATAVKRTC